MTSLDEVLKSYDPKKHVLQVDHNYAFILNMETRKTEKAWKKTDAGFELLDIEAIVVRVAAKLKDSVDAEALLKEHLLAQTHPAFLVELDERLMKPKVKVTSKPKHCYALHIGGKKGRPLELALVHNEGNSG